MKRTMKIVMKLSKRNFLLVSGVLLSTLASAQTRSYSVSSPYTPPKKEVGMKRVVVQSTGVLNTLHGSYELNDKGAVGLGFGFDNDFDTLLINFDYRHNLIVQNSSAVFAEFDAGLYKTAAGAASQMTFPMAALLGVSYRLAPQLSFSVAYGVQAAFKNTTNHFGFTSNDAFGNFAVHWTL